MPTSPHHFLLGLLSLLTLAAADGQAQSAASQRARPFTELVSHKHPTAEHILGAARSINTTVVVPGQEVGYGWNNTARRWDVYGKVVYTYDSQARVTQQVYQDSATSVPSYRQLYAYNAQGQETSYTSQNWTGSAWVNSSRYLTTYDSRGNETLFQSQNWTGSAWVTNSAYQSVYTYNAAGLATQVIRQELQSGVYINTDRFTYTFTNGQWSELVFETWNGGAWVNDSRIVDIVWYNWADKLPLSYREQNFNGTSFVDERRTTYTYGSNGGYVEITQKYVNAAWVNYRRNTYSQDSRGNELESIYESWVNNAWKQEGGDRYISIYNASSVLLRQVRQGYDVPTLQYVNSNRSNFSSFQTITLTSARNPALDARAELYPNPTAGATTLTLDDVRGGSAATGEVLNGLGQRVQVFTIQPQQGKWVAHLDLSKLPAGVYTVRLQTPAGTVGKRVVRY